MVGSFVRWLVRSLLRWLVRSFVRWFVRFLFELYASSNSVSDFKTISQKRISLWFFILELLDLDKCQTCVGWTYEEPYEFAIKNPDELAALWGSVKENPTMTYAKLARGLRYYYGKNIIEKVCNTSMLFIFISYVSHGVEIGFNLPNFSFSNGNLCHVQCCF